ncbi:MAG: hypothetical protein RI544_07600, partial [Haloquadratum sp.]|nr:hypothetical protein [Haloquadratum sp.]
DSLQAAIHETPVTVWVGKGEAAAVIADAPLVEGAVAAAVTATDPDADLARVREEAERAGG